MGGTPQLTRLDGRPRLDGRSRLDGRPATTGISAVSFGCPAASWGAMPSGGTGSRRRVAKKSCMNIDM